MEVSLCTTSITTYTKDCKTALQKKKKKKETQADCKSFINLISSRYLDFFPDDPNKGDKLYIDKSANYFDSLKAPQRAHSILPDVKIIVISTDPKLRAYSWYQVSVFVLCYNALYMEYLSSAEREG